MNLPTLKEQVTSETEGIDPATGDISSREVNPTGSLRGYCLVVEDQLAVIMDWIRLMADSARSFNARTFA